MTLIKGQKLDITKNNPGVNKVLIGWDWDGNFRMDVGPIIKCKEEEDCDKYFG
ncbi:hypothetical protein MKZ02_06200 [Pseudobacillus sp. FSL P4-0506]|uniref:hypothetical protein n=1 Tax=unclassified Pseudobacillus TaxID=2619284 RepID=UPI0030FA1193